MMVECGWLPEFKYGDKVKSRLRGEWIFGTVINDEVWHVNGDFNDCLPFPVAVIWDANVPIPGDGAWWIKGTDLFLA